MSTTRLSIGLELQASVLDWRAEDLSGGGPREINTAMDGLKEGTDRRSSAWIRSMDVPEAAMNMDPIFFFFWQRLRAGCGRNLVLAITQQGGLDSWTGHFRDRRAAKK